MSKLEIIDKIIKERERQDKKWGFPQRNNPAEWGCILTEEVGELCKELNELNWRDGNMENLTAEAIQVAAVAMSILEHLDLMIAKKNAKLL